MTRIAQEQRQQLQTSAERVATKLEDFHNGLPDGERLMLDFALERVVATRAAAPDQDVSGHLGPVGVVIVAEVVGYLTAKAVDNFISSTDWGAVGDFLTRGGSNAFNPQGRQSPL